MRMEEDNNKIVNKLEKFAAINNDKLYGWNVLSCRYIIRRQSNGRRNTSVRKIIARINCK